MLWMLINISDIPEDFKRAEKEIMQLWEETIKEYNIPFSTPKEPKGENKPDYEQNICSADCRSGSCSISCYGIAICGCTSGGEPVCRCIGSGYVPAGLEDLNRKHSYFGIYTIYDINGRKVFEGRLNGKLPGLKKGVYFIKGEDGKVRRVVVR